MRRTNKITGFTLVELMIATAFIGSLLLVIALVVMQVTTLYTSGLTIKEVNAVSRTVVRDMQQSIANSDAFALAYYSEDDEEVYQASNFTELEEPGRSDYYKNATGGRLCTGSYSYAWNTGQALREEVSATNALQGFEDADAPGNVRPVTFVKVRDTQKRLCRGAADELNRAQFLPAFENAEYQEVFGQGNNSIVLYDFDIRVPGENDGIVGKPGTDLHVPYYTISMVVGTQSGDELIEAITAGGQSCKAPSESEFTDSEYCAVNKIEFVARSGALGL